MKRNTQLALLILLLVFAPATYGQAADVVQVETVQLKSSLVGKTLPYHVVLPNGYRKSRGLRFPVLYLLHGLDGHYTNWLSKTKLKDYAERYQIIIVTPEGHDSWYTDSATVATDRYETYMLEELIPDVERRYRAIRGREGRAIAGLSMGGYGAVKFGLKHPDKFVFAGSMSGAMDPAVRSDDNPRNVWAFLRKSIMEVFGPPDSATRAANDVHKLAREFPEATLGSLPFFYLDCGLSDGLLATNRELATIFAERRIPHEYRQLPGNHSWTYWNAQVQEVLRLASQKLKATDKPAPPGMRTVNVY